jgi:hypothetical protein
MLVTIWAVGTLAVRMEAREGTSTGWMLDCCLPSREAWQGRALKDEALPLAKRYHSRVQQVSIIFNFVL